MADLGANVNMRKRTVRIDPDVMEHVSTEWGNKGDWISLKIGDMGEETEEVTFNELFLWDPVLFSAVVDDCVLVGVSVDDKGTGRGVEEVGEEVGYWYLCER